MRCQDFGHSKWVVNEVSYIGHEFFNARIAVGKGSGYARLKRVVNEEQRLHTTRKHLAVSLNTPGCENCLATRDYIADEQIARIEGFSRAPEIGLRYEIKARKVMVDFKFDALYS